MNKKQLILINIMAVTILVAVFTPLVLGGETEKTIVGVVNNESYLEAADGNLFKVVETEMGVDLLERVGEKLEVMGVITEENGVKVIRVTAFTAVEE